MARTLTCPSGHIWDVPGDATSFDSTHSLTCPICGSDTNSETVNPSSAESKSGRDPPPGAREPAPTLMQLDTKPDIPGFEILDELGRGGMGVVYRARQKSLDRIVALKMLLAGPWAGGEELSRLRSEAESIARLQHPNIVHVYDIGEHQGWTFISLEYLEGGNLAKTLDGQPRTPHDAAELTETLARAVHAAHQRGVVHRDLKPANVLLSSDGTPKITDFGLAKRIDMEAGQTRTGAVMGTPSYMAPEQAEGKTKSVGPATDVYALGAILYELLTGRPPFQSDSAFGVMLQVVNNSPVSPRKLQPGLPQELERICLTCLNKDPARRFPSALALADELKRFRAQPSIPVAPAAAPRSAPSGGSKPAGLIAAGLLALTGAAFLIYHYSGKRGSPNSPSVPQAPPELAQKQSPAAWTFLTVGQPNEKFDRIAFPSRNVGFAASRERLYKSIDGGKTWLPQSVAVGGRVHVLQFQDERNGWLATDNLRRTTDGGGNWQVVSLPGSEAISAITALAFDANGVGLAGATAKDGSLLLFRRRGSVAPWESVDAAATGWWGKDQRCRKWYVGEIAFRAPSAAVAALFRGSSDEGVVLSTVSGGEKWGEQFLSPHDVYRVRFADAKHGWLAGNRGALWATDNGGDAWTPISVSNADEIAVSCLAISRTGSFGVAPLWQGEMLVTTDGKTWRTAALDGGFGYSMPSAVVTEDRTAFVLSSDGRIAVSRVP